MPLLATFNAIQDRNLFPTGQKAGILNASISARITSVHTNVISASIIGKLPGSDPKLRNEYVIYTVHLDQLGIGAEVRGDQIYNGTQDNAAGVAGLLEIARAFATMRTAPLCSILFLAVTGEEKGLLGSDYFVEHPVVPLDSIVANINIEGLGLGYDFRDVVALGAEFSSLGNVVHQAARRLNLEEAADGCGNNHSLPAATNTPL